MKKLYSFSVIAVSAILVSSCHDRNHKEPEASTPQIKEDSLTYTVDSLTMKSFVYYDEKKEGKRPAVLVVHEWWGLNDYPKRRARQLAEMGYISMAVDMYGNGKMGNDPDAAGKLATPFYQNPEMAKKHFDAALEKLKGYAQTDTAKMAGIGYCFGGGVLINIARLGASLDGVVSFHGSLIGTPANKDLLKAAILVCHGEDDQFVPAADVAQFKKQMDSIGADYTFKSYPGATHAFSNPDATAVGKKFSIPIAYHAAADSTSWKDMKEFLERIFR